MLLVLWLPLSAEPCVARARHFVSEIVPKKAKEPLLIPLDVQRRLPWPLTGGHTISRQHCFDFFAEAIPLLTTRPHTYVRNGCCRAESQC